MTTTPETTADGRLIANSEDEARVFAAFGTPYVMAADVDKPTDLVAQDDDEAAVYKAFGHAYRRA